MSGPYLENRELDEALDLYCIQLQRLGIGLNTEVISVAQAGGRITAEAVWAQISAPHYNACAMDGIALQAKSTFGATDTTPVTLREGSDFIRVDTGDPLPEHFDSVVMIEEVIEVENGVVQLLSAAAPWQHVRQIGEDLCAGDMIVPSNTRIEAAALGALLAGGVLQVKVWAQPRVGIIPTGDEIVPPTVTPQAGEIIEFNSVMFAALLKEWGAVAKVYPIIPDQLERIRAGVAQAAEECDLVLLNAGSSAGREDYSARVIGELGEVWVHGVAIRPGKPVILGAVSRCPVIGIPGYPVSGMIVMEQVVKPVLAALGKWEGQVKPRIKAILARKLNSSLKYQEYVRVKVGKVDGRMIATPLNRGAGVVTSLVKADGLVTIPLNVEGFEAGQEVEVELSRSAAEIEQTLVIVGSHDPLLDLMADQMRREAPNSYMASAHVGSMGGLMAIQRQEAHLAGIHLLDETTGEYNTSFIRSYLKREPTLLIRGVKRIQGIMTAPGNPVAITGLADLSRDGLRYVNRQKGSGTRILLDYLLRQARIAPSGIYGYNREEFTHLAVAALIASRSADAGLGIYSAAQIYGLGFIPIWEEQYDFILPARFGELPLVKHFIAILRSRALQTALQRMGGYQTDQMGTVEMIAP